MPRPKKPEPDKKKPDVIYDASKIKILGGIEAVRKRPAMYIGSTGKSGLHHLIYEVVDNSIDEALAGQCDTINVTIHKDNTVTVKDNGRGIPIDIHKETKRPAVEVVLTTLHAGGKFGDSAYKVSGGLPGVGVSCVNALSEWMEVEVRRDGKLYEQHFDRGKPKKEQISSLKAAEKVTGTTIYFKPDKEIFPDTIFERKTIEGRMRELAFLNRGITITFTDERETSKELREQTFKFDGGVVSYVEHLNEEKDALYKPPIYISAERDNIFVEVAMQHVKDYYDENIYTFVNCIKTREGGTHLVGFKSALTKAINTYARKNNLLKENETLEGDDVREGLTAVINTRIPNPQFEGQTKMKLGNSEVKGIVDSVVVDGLGVFFDKNPAAARAVVEKSLVAFRVRMAARKAQELERKKSALDTATLPGKLADCSESNPEKCELFIVEGDSAGGCHFGKIKVALVDGRDLSFEELAEEHKQGKKNYCYTMQENGHIGIAPILHPRLTRKKAKVIKLILDNGEEIICTPNHPYRLVDGSYVPAAKLTPEQSLAPLYRKISKKKNGHGLTGYEMLFDPKAKRWNYTHVLADMYNLSEGVYGSSEGVARHHADFNKRNNNPDNIVRMTHKAHLELHQQNLVKTMHSPEVKCRSAEAKRTPEFREKRKRAYAQTYLENSLHFLKQVLGQRGDIFFYDHDRRSLQPRNNNLLSLNALKERFFGGDEEKVLEAAQNYNHKIKRIEKVEERYDVYDIEVPHTHNFALASGVFVHNSAKQGRDRRFQAILPLRGKILNVEKSRLDKILASQEIRILITAIGPGTISGMRGAQGNGDKEENGENTYEKILKELRYHKIILLADADVDGAHIRTLLLTFFYRYARELIDNGHLYIAQPPLYLVKKGKTQQYCFSDKELEKTLKAVGKEGAHVQRYKGLGEMNPEQLWETTLNPESRTLLQVTLEDAEAADEIFKILMGSEVEPRRKFIQENAKFVKNLDV
jgi:DNA gyrase subunit B